MGRITVLLNYASYFRNRYFHANSLYSTPKQKIMKTTQIIFPVVLGLDPKLLTSQSIFWFSHFALFFCQC